MTVSRSLTSMKFDGTGFAFSIESLIFLSVMKRLKREFAFAVMSSRRTHFIGHSG